ncbi:MAG TPA: bacillithiol biosynthesis deacetylase BshB1 [Candidatus Eisenbacteria bacterium]|nr:bacillithiol biosynthesis deacetylase BshB1 [Candidatus Eisenbacteria bacterium]
MTVKEPGGPLDLLAVGAHPDDVEISCGGTLALAAAQGLSVGILDLTRGELATNGTPEERAREGEEAARILSARGRWNAGLPDGGIAPHDPSQVAAVVAWIRSLRPAVLLTHFPRDKHPDHVAASEMLDRAWYLAGLRRYEPATPPFRPEARYHFASRVGFTPSFVVDVTTAWDAKRRAILAHATQVTRSGAGARPTPLNADDFLDRIEARARHYGMMIGARYGEPFHSTEPLGIRSLSELLGAPRTAPGSFTG